MTPLEIIFGAVALCGTVCSIICGVVAFRRGQKNDDTQHGHTSGVMLADIGYIKAGVDDIKRKQEKQEEQHIETVGRLTAVEESSKQAHKRIDRIEERIKA